MSSDLLGAPAAVAAHLSDILLTSVVCWLVFLTVDRSNPAAALAQR
jgi:hypothetical protein